MTHDRSGPSGPYQKNPPPGESLDRGGEAPPSEYKGEVPHRAAGESSYYLAPPAPQTAGPASEGVYHHPAGASPQASSQQHALDFLDLRHYLEILHHKAWLVALCVVMGLAGAGVYIMRFEEFYTASVVVEVAQEEQKVIDVESLVDFDFKQVEILKTIEQKLKTKAVLLRVVEKLDLSTNYVFRDPNPDGEPHTELQMLERLGSLVSVSLRGGTRLIDVSVKHRDRDMAMLLARTLVEEFLRQHIEQRVSATQQASRFLLEEASKLREKMLESERKLQELKEKNQTVSVENEQNIVIQKLNDLNKKLTEAKTERLKHEVQYNQIKLCEERMDQLLTLPIIANDPSVVEANRWLAQEKVKLANLAERYRPRHPDYQQAQSLVKESENALKRAARSVAKVYETAYTSSVEEELQLMKALAEQEKLALQLQERSIEYNVQSRAAQTDREVYKMVMRRLNEMQINEGVETHVLSIAEPVYAPRSPASANKKMVFVFGGVCGFMVGFFLAIVLTRLETAFKSSEDAERDLGIPCLGAVPKFSPLLKGPHLSDEDFERKQKRRNRIYKEAFRTIHTSLMTMRQESEPKTYLVCSGIPSEGKTFCSANLARSMADQGYQTLLLECDFRKPTMSTHFDTLKDSKGHTGVSDVMFGNVAPLEALQDSGTDNLWVMAHGSLSRNYTECFSSHRFSKLLHDVSYTFDRVVVDTAAIHALSDVIQIANCFDCVCLVVGANQIPRESCKRALNLLKRSGGKTAGFIFNKVSVQSVWSFYHSYSQYGGYYGQYMDELEDEKLEESPWMDRLRMMWRKRKELFKR